MMLNYAELKMEMGYRTCGYVSPLGDRPS